MRKAVSTFTPLNSRQLELGSALAPRSTCLTLDLSVCPDSQVSDTLHSSSFFFSRFCMPWFSWESASLVDGNDHGACSREHHGLFRPWGLSAAWCWPEQIRASQWNEVALFLFQWWGVLWKYLSKRVIIRAICLLIKWLLFLEGYILHILIDIL